MKNKLFIIVLMALLIPGYLFATVDVRAVFVSNTGNTPTTGQGTLVIDIEAISSTSSVNVSGFQTGILLDANLIAQYVSSSFSNQLFPAANYTTTQDYNATTGPGRIRFIYTYSSGTYGVIGTSYTRVLTISIVYNMNASLTSSIAWRVGTPTWTVLDQAATNITGSQVPIPVGLTGMVLPVELTSMTAAAQGVNSAIIKWSTATEANNSGFDIERRAEGGSWAKVAFVAGAGTSNSPKQYSYQDNAGAGVFMYRLKQIDNTGAFKYSSSVEVNIGVAGKVLQMGNYPNPFNPSTEIQFSVPADGFATLKVFNMLGQEVATLFSGVAKAGHYMTATFNANRFASGVYLSRLEYNGQSMVQRMLLAK